MRPLKEISTDIDQTEGLAAAHMTQHWDAAKSAMKYAIGTTEHTELMQMNERLAELDTEHKAAKAAAGIQDRLSTQNQPNPAFKGYGQTLGELWLNDQAVKGASPAQIAERLEVSIKGMSTRQAVIAHAMKTAYPLLSGSGGSGGGFQQYPAMTDIVVPYANQTPVIMDYINDTPYDQPAVLWREEDLQDFQADIRAEAAAANQSTLRWINKTVPMQSISHYVVVSKEQLEDAPMVATLIDQEGAYGCRLKIQDKLLNGAGGSNDIEGILNKAGVQSQSATGLDTGAMAYFPAIRKAFTKVRGLTAGTGFAEPSIVVLNPADWETMSLTKDNIGRYIYGDPANETVPRVFGKPIVSTISIASGNGLTGDFSMWTRTWTRHGITITTGVINDQFIKNLRCIMLDVRMCQTITRPSAFCNLTNLPTAG